MLTGFGFHFHHNTSIHLEETAVGVPSKLRIAGFFSKSFNDFVVDTEVKNGVHHPGHRLTSTGANGKEERVFKVTKLLAHGFLDLGNICFDFSIKSLRILLRVIVVVSADFGGDGETSRDGDSDAAHLGEVRPFPPKKSFHRSISVALSCAEVIDVFCFLGGCLFGGLFSGLFFGSHGVFVLRIKRQVFQADCGSTQSERGAL